MSRRVHNNNKEVRVKEARTMLCTHCKNMGEAKHVYEDHNVRDAKGLISCPKIKKMYVITVKRQVTCPVIVLSPNQNIAMLRNPRTKLSLQNQ